MKNELFQTAKQAVKYWWTSLLIGILSIILAIWCLATPTTTLAVLGALFIAGFFIAGIFEIIFAISNRERLNGWGWTLASGIIDILFALLLIATPLGTIATLIFFVGFWALFQSIWVIGSSIELQRNGIGGWGWVLAFGILGLIFSFILITNPVFAAGFIIYMLAFTLLFYGISRIYYGFKLKSVGKKIDEIEKDN
ncbi:DUF308 domain-containing protein [Dysgonomonas sp. Marseille-P4677]|uniref:HdeD family acid-resistance protein n=1 Tax=Dysgonomonas sp. Marseille-P4677 TaxID=2364790 RepID=UPI001911B905|nr:DUF308 domain-containing protein [Dysgonomonas sp. Marseille-P4677]MBK5721557.1 DUF308 domain-containing protein [Dysgonomonas sp. Marseille-P4677]